MKATVFLAGIVVGVALVAAFALGRLSAPQTATAASGTTFSQVVSQLRVVNSNLRSLDSHLTRIIGSSSVFTVQRELQTICRYDARIAGETSLC